MYNVLAQIERLGKRQFAGRLWERIFVKTSAFKASKGPMSRPPRCHNDSRCSLHRSGRRDENAMQIVTVASQITGLLMSDGEGSSRSTARKVRRVSWFGAQAERPDSLQGGVRFVL